MYEQIEKPKKNKSWAVSNSVAENKNGVQQGFGLVDNRPEAIAQRKLKERENNRSKVRQLRSFQGSAGTSQQGDIDVLQLQKIKVNALNGKSDSVIQLGTWNKTKVEKYKDWLRRRAARRWAKNKRKNALKLVRKYVRARMLAEPGWSPHLADAPTAGHHVPPLALSNKHGGSFAFGKRGSSSEKLRPRVYFAGSSSDREEAHWLAHEAEAMQGINRQSTFSGNDKDLGNRVVAAHHGLTLMNGTGISVERRSQQDPSTGTVEPIGTASRSIVELQGGFKPHELDNIDDDSTDSEPDSDFETRGSDSDTYSDTDSDTD